eukprot:3474887-Pleurochrysis_carterae.AAC.1
MGTRARPRPSPAHRLCPRAPAATPPRLLCLAATATPPPRRAPCRSASAESRWLRPPLHERLHVDARRVGQ